MVKKWCILWIFALFLISSSLSLAQYANNTRDDFEETGTNTTIWTVSGTPATTNSDFFHGARSMGISGTQSLTNKTSFTTGWENNCVSVYAKKTSGGDNSFQFDIMGVEINCGFPTPTYWGAYYSAAWRNVSSKIACNSGRGNLGNWLQIKVCTNATTNTGYLYFGANTTADLIFTPITSLIKLYILPSSGNAGYVDYVQAWNIDTYGIDGATTPPSEPIYPPSGTPILNLTNLSVVLKNQTLAISGVSNATGYEFYMNSTLKQNLSTNTCSNNCAFPSDGYYRFSVRAYNTAGYGNYSIYDYIMNTQEQVMCIWTLKACSYPYFIDGYWYCDIENVINCNICNEYDANQNYSLSQCDMVSCHNDCTTQDAFSCMGLSSLQQCLLSDDGCYHNYFVSVCSSGYYCSQGACIYGNVNETQNGNYSTSDYTSNYYSDDEINKRMPFATKIIILIAVILFVDLILFFIIMQTLHSERIGFIVVAIASIFSLIASTVPSFPYIGGLLPFWILAVFILCIIAVTFLLSRRKEDAPN